MGPYQLLAKIGEGGMGTVYLAKLEGGLAGFNKLAVVKELRADLVGSPAFVNMFLDEARLAARLNHPNVVHTYEADAYNGRLYIAMEYLDGQPWSRVRHRLWANRTLPLAVHLRVLADVLAGLHYAHELQDFAGAPLNVVHCDMSPQNVFVTYDGQVKVVDFGVARAAHFSRKLSPDLFFGKLSYCAPEQARGEDVDRRADIFSVGVMLWEALTGRRFAAGNNTTVIRRLRVRGEEPRVREVAPTLPRALADICDRALATAPGDRFGTAAEFREQLMGYLSQHSKGGADDLGGLVTEAFGPERARVRGLVRQRLEGPDSDVVEDLMDAAEHEIHRENTLAADLSRLASVSRVPEQERADSGLEEVTVPTVTLAAEASRALKPKPWDQQWFKPALGAVLALVAAAAGVLVAAGGEPSPPLKASVLAPAAHAPEPAAAQRPQPAGPPAQPQVPASEAQQASTVELVLSASPLEAVLYLDGERLASNPYVARPKVDAGEHRITARAPGYHDKELVVRFDQDRIVAMELRRNERLESEARRERRARRAAAAAKTPRNAQVAKPEASSTAAGETRAGKAPPDVKEVDFGERLSTEGSEREIYDEVPF